VSKEADARHRRERSGLTIPLPVGYPARILSGFHRSLQVFHLLPKVFPPKFFYDVRWRESVMTALGQHGCARSSAKAQGKISVARALVRMGFRLPGMSVSGEEDR
jgi:hypothetical protein